MRCGRYWFPVRGECFFGGVGSISHSFLGRTLTLSVFAFSWKRQAEVPALAPRKSLKVSTSSTAIQHGAALVRVDPKEPVAQGEVAEAETEVGQASIPP